MDVCYGSDTGFRAIGSCCSLFKLGVRGFECYTNRRYGTDTTWIFSSESRIRRRRCYTCTDFDLGVFNTRDWTLVAVSCSYIWPEDSYVPCSLFNFLSTVDTVNGLFRKLKLVENQCCAVDSRPSSRISRSLVMFTESRHVPLLLNRG